LQTTVLIMSLSKLSLHFLKH